MVTICFCRKLCLSVWGWTEDTLMIRTSLGCSTPAQNPAPAWREPSSPTAPTTSSGSKKATAFLLMIDFVIHLHIFLSDLLISLLSWPSSGEAKARLSVYQSPGSSRGYVQCTIWTVKCAYKSSPDQHAHSLFHQLPWELLHQLESVWWVLDLLSSMQVKPETPPGENLLEPPVLFFHKTKKRSQHFKIFLKYKLLNWRKIEGINIT